MNKDDKTAFARELIEIVDELMKERDQREKPVTLEEWCDDSTETGKIMGIQIVINKLLSE